MAEPLQEGETLRVGADIASVVNGEATLQIVLEESDDLSSWSHRETIDVAVPLQEGETREFFRCAIKDASLWVDPDQFAVIPAGSFQMGDHLDGLSDADAPVVTVHVSEFYMGKYEVTKSEWDAVHTWGESNGYEDLSDGSGKAADHPVQTISWIDMVKWCNARSEMEGRTPCYTVDGSTYREGLQVSVECDWTANGYRLPTEAEWEKAARGGLSGQRFPSGDTISHVIANYTSNSSVTVVSYDETGAGGFSGEHPIYDDGSPPYTSPVGSFAANGYGLYDMAGNVFEWCWDRYGGSSYSDGATDPRGAVEGTNRVVRGGSYLTLANKCRVADRSSLGPAILVPTGGFRVALSSVSQ